MWKLSLIEHGVTQRGDVECIGGEAVDPAALARGELHLDIVPTFADGDRRQYLDVEVRIEFSQAPCSGSILRWTPSFHGRRCAAATA